MRCHVTGWNTGDGDAVDIRAMCPFLIVNPLNVGERFLWLTFRFKQRGVERGLLGKPIWPLLIFREDEHMTAWSLYKSTDFAAILASLCSAKELKSLKQKGRVGNEWSNIGQRWLWPAASHVLIILKNTQGIRRTTMSNMFTQPYFLQLLHFLRKGESPILVVRSIHTELFVDLSFGNYSLGN